MSKPSLTEQYRDESTESTRRISVSLPPKQLKMLSEISIKKHVSIAWVIRDAVESYLSENGK